MGEASDGRRSVIVTGAAAGIGQAVMSAFTSTGAHVVGVDRQPTAGAAAGVVGDVREPDTHRRAVEAAMTATGHVDVLVVNAGVHDGGMGTSADAGVLADTMRSVFDINVVGAVLAVQAAGPALRASRGVVIVTLSDAAFLAGQTGAGVPYTASKYALLGVTRWAARALAPEVRVNAVAPGGVVTDLRAVDPAGDPDRELFADAEEKRRVVAARNPLGTVLEPAELAAYYLFLASEDARGMTGEVLRPDGGLSLR